MKSIATLPARRLVATGLCVALSASPAFAATTPANCTPAEMFAPDQVTTSALFESRLTFTPSRNTIYWSVNAEPAPPGSDVRVTLYTADRVAGGWTAPAVASVSGVYSDSDPFVSPYGDSLFFSSSRPGGVLADTPLNDIWISRRTATGWGVPFNPGPAVNSPGNELYASADIHGTLYFASDRDRGQWDLYRSRLRPNGEYAPAEKLPGNVTHPTRWEFNPEISPDGRTLLYATYGRPDSYGDVDLYVSRMQPDGKFSNPRNLGPCVNTAAPEFHPTVLWDRDELYFVRVNETTDFYSAPLQLP